MFHYIIKRDGKRVRFNSEKITNAIAKAGAATGEFDYSVARMLTLKVLSLAEEVIRDRIPTVEEIQDIVEEVLLGSVYRKTAKAYILYRDQHARIREITTKADIDLVDQYLRQLDWQVQENSNMAFSLQGLNNYISSEVSKIYWLNKIYPPEVRNAHLNGDIHIHDLNILSVYCVGWDLLDLLREGFRGAPGEKVKLDTNGSIPERLQSLLNNALIDYVAMDYKAPLRAYSRVASVEVDTEKIRESVSHIVNSGVQYEIRTTLYSGLGLSSLVDIVRELEELSVEFFYIQFPKAFENPVNDLKISAEQIEYIHQLLMCHFYRTGIRNLPRQRCLYD
jgi:hypothetical protein